MENSFWRTLSKNMNVCKGWREATRHEDKLQLGIADVSFVNNDGRHGWIELKRLREWPKRESTIVRLPHFTDHQRIWLRRKGEAGGNAWLLVKIERDVLLFDWETAYVHVGGITKQEMIANCKMVWFGKMDYSELGQVLCAG